MKMKKMKEMKKKKRKKRRKKKKSRCYTQRITRYVLLDPKQEALLSLTLILLMWRIW